MGHGAYARGLVQIYLLLLPYLPKRGSQQPWDRGADGREGRGWGWGWSLLAVITLYSKHRPDTGKG